MKGFGGSRFVFAAALGCLATAFFGCAVVPGGGGPQRVRALEAVTNRTWQWEAFVTPAETITVAAPERYTLELAPNGRALIRADCNRGTGAYRVEDGKVFLGPFATTRMACPPGSLDDRFLRELQRATAFFVEGDRLFLELPVDSGTLRFRPAR